MNYIVVIILDDDYITDDERRAFMNKAIKVGIDVGGTHTKAVAIDNETHEIIGKASVMTTHNSELGVAEGVIEAFRKCLYENNIAPEDVIFIAHSTTQATNALLEGDVANVGIFGIGKGGLEGFLAKKQTNIKDIPLGTGKFIKTFHVYRKVTQFDDVTVKNAIEELKNLGAEVIVASKAFGVDGVQEEEKVYKIASEIGIPCSMASDISKLYGLTIRTRTAAINASILPKMLETANSTEKSIKSEGIKASLMIMRGDGGVMEVDEMKKRPVLTMLSGPAASVMGSLMYLRASNGIYFEVGGTSTNIGVIKNGRPAVDYAVVGGHRTYINSIDVRVLGVAGGSMVRVSNGKIIDVGPRSAHIAGLDYASFTPEEEIVDPQIEFIKPKKDDPSDYVAIRLKNGKRITITNTCAANALKLIEPEYYAYGNYKSCYKAIEPLAKYLNQSVEETAMQILEKSCEKIIPVIDELSARYKLEKDQSVLVGVGGGAAALLPYMAQKMNIKYRIPENAEIISSIGVALATVRDVVERVIPNPSTEDISKIKREAKDMAIKSGAIPETIEVTIEIDAQTQKVSAIAIGSTEIKTTDLLKKCSENEIREIAAESMSVNVEEVNIEETNGYIYVCTAYKNNNKMIRVIDKKGFIKVQRRDGEILKTDVKDIYNDLKKLWEKSCQYRSDLMIVPDIFIILGPRVIDYSGISNIEQIQKVLATELFDINENEKLIIVSGKNDLYR
jgi:N-methylhydantoinase A/oxoprolinase/acetone carboxylase beta subunit